MTRTIKSIAGTMTVLMLAACTNLRAEPAGKEPVGPRRGASPHFWDQIPVSPSTRIPEEIKDGYWHGQHKRINQAVAQADHTKIVFFGDSITWHWDLGQRTGKNVWEEYYSRYKPINMGNSGDITPVMLYRATHGNLDFAKGPSPNVAVLLCGTNNYVVNSSAGGKVRWGLGAHCPPADVAHGARAVAQVFRRRMPHTRVIMMGILPVSNEAKWAKCRETNALHAALAYNKNEVIYLDLQNKFLQADGAINQRLFADGTHLTPEGYRLWAQSLEPIVSKIMRSEPLDPVKIMLIGGSITEGLNSSGSYRRYLDGMLRRSGHLIDFIGSRKKHNNNKTQVDSYEYDVDHEGHWDKGTQWLAEHMPGLLAGKVADVAVIHMGTKEIVSGSSTAEKIVGDIGKVIDALRAKNKAVKIVLASIIPAKSKADEIGLLNREMVQYTKTHSTARSPILIADQHTGFNPSSDLADDGVLPTAAGAQKMAEVFAGVINKALSNTDRE